VTHLGNLSFYRSTATLLKKWEEEAFLTGAMEMDRRKSSSWLLLTVLACGIFVATSPALMAQEVQGDLSKRVKTRVQPTYPELAKRMAVRGTVKLMVTVGTNGKVKNTKVVGGHPVLVGASEDAIRRWKFEPAADETTGIVEFTFQADN
jgi:TonB family protein